MKITSSRGLKVVEEAFYANAKLDSEILICSTSWNFPEGELCEHARMRLVLRIDVNLEFGQRNSENFAF